MVILANLLAQNLAVLPAAKNAPQAGIVPVPVVAQQQMALLSALKTNHYSNLNPISSKFLSKMLQHLETHLFKIVIISKHPFEF